MNWIDLTTEEIFGPLGEGERDGLQNAMNVPAPDQVGHSDTEPVEPEYNLFDMYSPLTGYDDDTVEDPVVQNIIDTLGYTEEAAREMAERMRTFNETNHYTNK